MNQILSLQKLHGNFVSCKVEWSNLGANLFSKPSSSLPLDTFKKSVRLCLSVCLFVFVCVSVFLSCTIGANQLDITKGNLERLLAICSKERKIRRALQLGI
jgi:hypothetical protein